ncbi:60S acidic ribosomal protein P1-like [Scyliorhinus canicula]|uniref:60S acidic ribosomal protein P1-like n=1 Tax=Scyliorhinus canicula TaxID=7830 RepID=UPI0018F35200|nr:60S acidic ribosomal protein P1-like [Scyliorhinus canicula]
MAFTSESPVSSVLILPDEVTEDKLNALIKTVGVIIEPFMPSLFAKALANIDTNSLICNVGAEEKKQEESEKSDNDMGFD